MIIKEIKEDKNKIWLDYYNFCIKSKPFNFCQIGSKQIRDKRIRMHFEEMCDSCRVFGATDPKKNSKIGYVFLTEEEFFFEIGFIFGKKKNNSSIKLIEGAHAVFDFLRKETDKYFKSEIRRTFKTDIYKKWIEKYDDRAIIFGDKNQTVIWSNKKMEEIIEFKVCASNEVGEYLLDKVLQCERPFEFYKAPRVCRVKDVKNQEFLLDIKSIIFYSDSVRLNSFISDEKKQTVSRIVLEFKP